jgi:hypothetical protein
MSEQARTVAELTKALRERAALLCGEKWEVPATAAMMCEAADALDAFAAQLWETAAKEADDRAKQFRDEASRCMPGGFARSARKRQAEAAESIAAAMRARAVSRSQDGEICQDCREIVRDGACCCQPAESPSVD